MADYRQQEAVRDALMLIKQNDGQTGRHRMSRSWLTGSATLCCPVKRLWAVTAFIALCLTMWLPCGTGFARLKLCY